MTWIIWLAIVLLLATGWLRRRAEEAPGGGGSRIKKWVARVGAVGGTARWAAKGYRFFRERHPDRDAFSDRNIFRLMIVHRYQTMPDDAAERILLARVDRMLSLSQLVVAILQVEAGFDENTFESQQIFMDVIEEELQKADVPRDLISWRSAFE